MEGLQGNKFLYINNSGARVSFGKRESLGSVCRNILRASRKNVADFSMYCRAIKSGFAPAGRRTSQRRALRFERPTSKSGVPLIMRRLARHQGCSVLPDVEYWLDFCQGQETFRFSKLSGPARNLHNLLFHGYRERFPAGKGAGA